MPSGLITALALLAVEIFRHYRAKNEQRTRDDDHPRGCHEQERSEGVGPLGDGTRWD